MSSETAQTVDAKRPFEANQHGGQGRLEQLRSHPGQAQSTVEHCVEEVEKDSVTGGNADREPHYPGTHPQQGDYIS